MGASGVRLTRGGLPGRPRGSGPVYRRADPIAGPGATSCEIGYLMDHEHEVLRTTQTAPPRRSGGAVCSHPSGGGTFAPGQGARRGALPHGTPEPRQRQRTGRATAPRWEGPLLDGVGCAEGSDAGVVSVADVTILSVGTPDRQSPREGNPVGAAYARYSLLRGDDAGQRPAGVVMTWTFPLALTRDAGAPVRTCSDPMRTR